ncbi:thiamine pyrophosphokinase [Neoconidiobolus thromboides FSU 785]|nr:thiamine pyrophosphokinase [Neoconidiobolus thromboides FSU 785]
MSTTTSNDNLKEWNLKKLLVPNEASCPFALIILNQPVNPSSEIFINLWNNARIRVCADGGANRLYDGFASNNEKRMNFLPDYIHGDLDSLLPKTKEYYENLDVNVIQDEDQYSTDLTKCYNLIKSKQVSLNLNEPLNIIIHGGIGGRFDHSLASIQSLYKFPRDITVLLYSPETLTFLLNKDQNHTIFIDDKFIGPTCGLLPIGGKVEKLYTTGLKWNLDGESSYFGGLVSTSNLIDDITVTIKLESEHHIIFTCEINEF